MAIQSAKRFSPPKSWYYLQRQKKRRLAEAAVAPSTPSLTFSVAGNSGYLVLLEDI